MAKKIKIRCPHCGALSFSDVTSTRRNVSLGSINRARKCNKCQTTFTTVEITVLAFNKLRDKAEVASAGFKAMAAHPKISELIEHAKKETKYEKRRGPREGI